jgi:signal peptidase I
MPAYRRHPYALFLLRFTIAMLALLSLARAFFFTSYRVDGSSMEEALNDGDRILVSDGLYGPIVQGDVIVFHVLDEVLVKRVIACPGDSVSMISGQVFVNNVSLEESTPYWLQTADTFPPLSLQSGEYFLLGDNRAVSVDSREFGPVREDQVMGKVLVRLHGVSASLVSALER